MTTINISLPASMYKDAKARVKRQGYASISELIRNALRGVLYPHLTVNGFTPEFEEEVLRASRDADAGDVVQWDGKGSFTDFVLKHPPKRNVTRRIRRSISTKRTKTLKREGDLPIASRTAYSAV